MISKQQNRITFVNILIIMKILIKSITVCQSNIDFQQKHFFSYFHLLGFKIVHLQFFLSIITKRKILTFEIFSLYLFVYSAFMKTEPNSAFLLILICQLKLDLTTTKKKKNKKTKKKKDIFKMKGRMG